MLKTNLEGYFISHGQAMVAKICFVLEKMYSRLRSCCYTDARPELHTNCGKVTNSRHVTLPCNSSLHVILYVHKEWDLCRLAIRGATHVESGIMPESI